MWYRTAYSTRTVVPHHNVFLYNIIFNNKCRRYMCTAHTTWRCTHIHVMCTMYDVYRLYVILVYSYIWMCTNSTLSISDFRAEFLVFTILILTIEDVHVAQNHRCLSTKQRYYITKQALSSFYNFYCRFLVYFTFCFRKKIIFQSSTIQ